ncbi:nucleotide disphospho-sugar-binding domain-containing protein [Janthinobacterium agaricidamnosum]|uniref:Glycosyltransferase, MGT family protein n=1 Tax=Janthinobacterium agaricidamnosum NBRC 102515 = DSM 9628 TaxID=1349767 RepID=W0V3D4_9BURK|nr:nucleotide disphospho-sugar-binding domain-containing protein [Janthinobacterium agaricidamnosum]CDG82381.1 glycosyltransferase, MGT family protein [Janthinobacterium agaricidamnosum NBRC 102515 = DSM 9628]
MTQIIIGATDAQGHTSPMLFIAADLVRRGHQVSFITGIQFQAAVEKTGATFVRVSGAAEFDQALFVSPERLALQGLDQVKYDLKHLVVDAMADQYRTLQRVLAQFGDDQAVVLTESGFYGVAPALHGAPGVRAKGYVVVGTVPLMLSSIDTAPGGAGLPPDSTPEGRARNAAQNEFFKQTLFGETQVLYAQELARLGATEPASFILETMATHADKYLQLSVEELSYKRSDLPAHIEFVGALPSPPSDAKLPDWWQDVLDAEQVVVVTQGTIANSDFSHLIEPTLEALAGLPVLVVAATGSDAVPAHVPANARVARFVPFVDLLPHTSILVSNGGFAGTQQALSFGVPMVLAGETEDKIEGNARTAHSGAAINLKTQRPTVAAIRAAVEHILATASYRQHARRLQAEYAGLDPYAAIAAAIAVFDTK